MVQGRQDPGEFELDPVRVRRSFEAAAASYDDAAVLQARVQDELLQRLDLVKLEPAVVVDLGARTGAGTAALRRRYRGARVIAVDLAFAMLERAGRRQGLFRRFDRLCADAAQLPLRDGSVDLVFSSLALPWCNDPDRVFAECRRVLRPGGLLSFTTCGPDTLVELRRAWAAADPHTHVNRFIDMHDLGDALLRAGLAEPVMDVERYTLTYATVDELVRDLRQTGAGNANAGRPRGLTGRRTRGRVEAAYEAMRVEGRLPASVEVVYGHAWAPVANTRQRPHGEVVIPLDRLRGSRRDR